MPSRLLNFIQRPWNGGLKTDQDAAIITGNNLQKARNIIFSTQASRKSRGGFDLFDYVAIGVQRSSSGTTRTIRVTFNSAADVPSASDNISVMNSSTFDTNYSIKKVSIDSINVVSGTTYDITYTMLTSLTETTTADLNIRVGLYDTTKKLIGLFDYWYLSAGVKQHKRVGVMSDGTFYEYDSNGSRTALTVDGSVSLTTPIADCSGGILGEKLVIAFSGTSSTNKPVIWDGSSNILHVKNYDFDGNNVSSANEAPNLEFIRVHQGRLFGTEKGVPDRIHYSDIEAPERWNGEGDSGAIDVAGGDGDSTGFVGITPPIKNRLFVGKSRKLYEIVGNIPLAGFRKVSDGIGIISHESCIAIDQDDVAFASIKGIHSTAATDSYGEFEGAFISKDIQPNYDALDFSDTSMIKGVYVPTINSLIISGREDGQTDNNVLYLYNVEEQKWYQWDSNESEFTITSMNKFIETNKDEFVIGTAEGRILKYNNDSNKDFGNSNINFDIKSGIIYPDNNPNIIKAFKSAGIVYKTERSNITMDIEIKIDAFDSQKTTLVKTPLSDVLGTSFTLGTSKLGSVEDLLPENFSIDGYGYGCTIRITSTDPIEVYAFNIEFESSGDQREVNR